MKKVLIVVIAFLLFSSTALLITSITSKVSALTITLSPVEASRPESWNPDTVFGGQGVYKYSSQEYRGYLKYDLSGISSSEFITSVTLTAHTWSLSQYANPFWIDIHHVSDDTWDDTLLTWNNKPDFDDLMGSTQFDDTITSWDLSGYDYTADILDGYLSIVMSKRDPEAAGVWFRAPILTVETSPIPEPATIALLGIGLVGLAGAEVRRRRKKAKNI